MNWKTFVYNDDPYIIKLVYDTPMYKIMLSNTVRMWTEELTVGQISERSKELNPVIDTNSETYLATVVSMIKTISTTNDTVINKIDDDNVNLDCKTRLIETPFKFTFHLKLSESETFCTELTIPLIQTIQFLESRQNHLLKVIEQNNEVIEQHVFENGTINRVFNHVHKFNKDEFVSSSDTLFCNVLSKSDFQKRILEKHPGPPELMSVLVPNVNKRKSGPSLIKKILKPRLP